MSLINKKNLPFILFTIILFIIEARALVMQGMFFDGVINFSIALNMANHIGSLWSPEHNRFFFRDFHEQLPFGIFLESLLFRFLNSQSIYLDKLHCVILAILNISMVCLIWRKTLPHFKKILIWIPILIWLLLFNNFSHIKNGYLDPTLTLFTSFSVLLILEGLLSQKLRWHFVASILMTLAFLVKGFQAYFALILPVIYWWVFRQNSFFSAVKSTVYLTVNCGIWLFIIFLYPPARENIQYYFELQLFPSLFGGRAGSYVGWRHLFGIWFIIQSCLCLIGLTFLAWLVQARQEKQAFLTIVSNVVKLKWVRCFFLIALSASLPLLLCSRQTDHYFNQAFPFIVLMFSHILTPLFEQWVERVKIASLSFRLTTAALVCSLCLICFAVVHSAGRIGRDKLILGDVLKIQEILPAKTSISVAEDLRTQWTLLAYLYRYHGIAANPLLGEDYYLQPKASANQPPGYHLENSSSLNLYNLYKKDP